ncbi:MAG: metal-dependent hydrolase [Ignavibacteria bacterium]|nr:MAG: metal-dependent hydrolase [Ignavibacteria bacterium]
MDFVTQVTLGGAVGQATMHRELGNKAVLWGLLAGALPDLDVVAYPLMDAVTQLTWHRSISHSILLVVVLSPLLGWLIARLHHYEVTVEKATLFSFLALGSHILIDLFTTYGTQIFAPFADTQVAWNLLFIIDPLFTLPLLLFLLLSMLPGEVRARQFRNAAGLILALAYVITALLFKFSADTAFERAFARQKIPVQRMMTTPTPLNTILWRGVAETADGYYIGYHSMLDGSEYIPLWFVPRNEKLLEGFQDQRAIQVLQWFSDGWYSAEQTPEGLFFRDLRYGEFDAVEPANSYGVAPPLDLEFMFTFTILDTGVEGHDRLTFEGPNFPMPDIEQAFDLLWKRIKGVSRVPVAGK